MKNKIKKFMLANFRNHLDDSNCLVMTSLAEEAAREFENEGNFLDESFEIAFDVQEILRRKNLINA